MLSIYILISLKVSKGAKIRNQYNQVPHLTQDTNGKVTNSQLDILLFITAVVQDETESEVFWQLNSPFLYYVNMKTATISSLIKEYYL